MSNEGRVTLRDVARASGVSATTVSFVLNNTPRQTIPDSTRGRVREAALTLGYSPHRIARALREGTSRIVLLSTGPWRTGRSLESFIAGVDDELRRHGHTLLVRYGHEPDESLADLLDAVAPRAVLDLAGIDVDREGSDWTDGLAPASAVQLRHLASRGHLAVALALPVRTGLGNLVDVRLAQAQRSAAALGLDEIVTVVVGDSRVTARAALSGLLERHPAITAVAGFDDDTALLALAALADLGLAVPQDIAVIGFDDSKHGAMWSPALTTVQIDSYAYGRRAACSALGIEAGAWSADPSFIVEREST